MHALRSSPFHVLLDRRRPLGRLIGENGSISKMTIASLNDVPDFFSGVAESAAGNTGTQAEVADTDRVILELVCEVVVTLGHGTDKDANALLRSEIADVIAHTNDGSVETQGDLAAVGRKVVGDGVLDDLQQLLLRCSRTNGKSVEELDHQTSETLEGTGNADGGADFDQDTLGRVNVDLEFAGLVERRVEQSEETLRIG